MFIYERNLKDLEKVEKNGYKVFSCFSCGGGSTMGYKMSGYDVIGTCEIDKKMNKVYQKNFSPKFKYEMGIQEMCKLNEFPEELYNLDILDGSPPCSSFSMAGNRGDDRGKEKKFREGQAEQVLDTLFFDFIELAKKLQPKIVIAENVKGLLLGDAYDYVQEIYSKLDEAGYVVDHFLLNASDMGVPQSRERIFFIAVRKDLDNIIRQKDIFHYGPAIDLSFNEKKIPFSRIEQENHFEEGKHIPTGILPYWKQIEPGRSCADVHEKGHYFQELKLNPNKPLPTLRAGSNSYYHYEDERRLYDKEIILGGSYPLDYDFNGNKVIYLVGMSVPPLMMHKVSREVQYQLLDRMRNKYHLGDTTEMVG